MEAELKQYLDDFATRFQQIDARFEKIDARFEKVDAQFREMREENAAAHEETRRVLRAENAAAHEETRRVLRAEDAETRLHFDATIDKLQSKFDLLGDGIKNIDEKLDREAADIRAEMRQGFADTHALIRFSHAQRTRGAKR